jgi:Protein of unknown function (DUF4058)
MPLLDHFHPPLRPERNWESMHALWAAAIVARLNEAVLPAMYYAETQIHIGSRVEVDAATMERLMPPGVRPVRTENGPVATLEAEVWAPSEPALVIPATFPDEIEVEVFGSLTGLQLVAAIELVSPGNKDRTETRRAFAAKCSSYLQLGIGLVVVDVVTERLANLHDELMRLMDQPERVHFPGAVPLYAVAYRPARREAGDQIDCWPHGLEVGQPLPIVPLALRGGPTLPLDLEVTYSEARRRSRL